MGFAGVAGPRDPLRAEADVAVCDGSFGASVRLSSKKCSSASAWKGRSTKNLRLQKPEASLPPQRYSDNGCSRCQSPQPEELLPLWPAAGTPGCSHPCACCRTGCGTPALLAHIPAAAAPPPPHHALRSCQAMGACRTPPSKQRFSIRNA